jgi:predicted alpha/beta superfamily hydrolase
MKQLLHIFWVLIFLTGCTSVQQHQTDKPVNESYLILGRVNKFQSVELGEARTLNIYLPEGYSQDSSVTYPVIYLLDGSANEDFIHIVGIIQFLTMIDAMPKSIVVGIANVDRRRDFTFPTSVDQDKKAYPTTGHSTTFIKFLENELEPFIQKKYKVSHNRTIIGQSLGGLLVSEILLKKPYLFDNYMIVSPSLWWNSESLLKAAPDLLAKQPPGNIKVYISIGNEEKKMVDDAKKFYGILQTSSKSNPDIFFMTFPAENHLTILHNSIYKGFEMIYPKIIQR